ncbi:PAS domain S-box protein [Methanooceanicella nereidis]|nr:PAS domain-containing sensor histidine kinase [Methanocella sp. CWC-04]
MDENQDRAKESLIEELEFLRDRIKKLEQTEIEKEVDANLITGVLDRSHDAMILLDTEDRLCYINDEARHIFNIRNEAMGEIFWAIYPKSTTSIFYKEYFRAKQDKKFIRLVEHIHAQNKWYEVHISPASNGTLLILYDITSRMHIDEIIRLVHYTINNYSDAVLWVKPNGRPFYVNRATIGYLGYEYNQLLNMRIFKLIPDFSEEYWPKIWKTIKDKKHIEFESVLQNMEGKAFSVDISCDYINFFDKEYICVNIHDITSRKTIMDELAKSEEKYRELVENANSMIVRMDVNGNINFFNEFAQNFFGYKKEEIIGKNILETIVPETSSKKEDLRSKIRYVIQHIEEYPHMENENILRNGERVWISWTNKAIKDSKGDIVEILSVGNDSTELKRYQDELEKAKTQAELYMDLMSHDINNMNQIGIGFLELALETQGIDENVKQLLLKPLDVLRNSSYLIQNVNKLQKAREGVIRKESVDLEKLLKEVISRYTHIARREVRIEYSSEQGCTVNANELLLDVFTNIISNSIRHSTGPLAIGVQMSKIQEGETEYCKVEIEDNGPGIPDDVKDRLFDRMRKREAKIAGKGLGLYLVKALIESFDGKILVEDRVKGDFSRGCKFIVLLPAVKDAV